MARNVKPISLSSRNLSKEEIESRKEAEKKLKGKDSLVYKPPVNGKLKGINFGK